jgi:hypothetical protein
VARLIGKLIRVFHSTFNILSFMHVCQEDRKGLFLEVIKKPDSPPPGMADRQAGHLVATANRDPRQKELYMLGCI